MAKLIYEKPKAELVLFDNSDVITTSGDCKFFSWGKEISCDLTHHFVPWADRNVCDEWGGKDCTGDLHKDTSGKCFWVNGNFSIGDDEW